MEAARKLLRDLKLPDRDPRECPSSTLRFEDGGE